MSDDSYIRVTLPFTFNFYNQQFTESWMYDNGIISFLQPGTPNAISNYQWYSQPLNQANGNYYIAALWADIAPTAATRYITQTDGTYMKYIWQNIAEYYSLGGNPRFSTFSTTIKNDGSISTHYTNINLQTSAISVGTVGDRSAGEYNQIYYSPCCVITNTGMISDWTIAGVTPPPPPPELPTQPEPVYVAPVVEEVVETTPSIVINEPVAQTTPVVTNTVSAVVQAATESSPGSVTTASIVAATSTSEPSNKMSAADAQAIARTNQRNANQLVMSVVNTSIENSTAQVISTDSETMFSTDSSTSTGTQSTTSSVNSVGQSSNLYGDTYNPTSTNVTGLANFSRLPGSFNNDMSNEVQNTSTVVENTETTDNTKPVTGVTEIVAVIADETNPTSIRSLAANNAIKQVEQEEEQEKKTIQIVDLARDSSLSELNNSGILLTELQVLPIGYNIYLAAILKDAPFYAPKAIYRNQTVVDNAPVQRRLQFASDAKFDQMVSQQYGEQK